jgi:indolepyruvate ferredoxin oxidoreductase, beta subunit
MDTLATPETRLDRRRPLAIAVLAMGGQGGGVLVDWILALFQKHDFSAQSTSVPGVAQRTGATLYYLEALPPDGAGRRPVFSLMPAPGEVDIVIGAELMEAGRAMQRGLVSPDRTTLIASSHRAYAVSEKIVPGDGAGEPRDVYDAAAAAAKRFIAFDMAAIADQTGSHISAVLLGALAGSGVLPFLREDFEATIRAGGVGVAASLRAFALGYDSAGDGAPALPPKPAEIKLYPDLKPIGDAGFDALMERARTLPEPAHGMVAAGLRRVVDFQDVAYGAAYLALIAPFAAFDAAPDHPLTRAAAKNIARAMAYDDVIRVADLKTRASRFDRVAREVGAGSDQIVYTTEYMHPGMAEICGTMPAFMGRAIESQGWLFRGLERLVNRGRRVETGKLRWFLPLYLLAGMRRFRRGTLRHRREVAHRDAWLATARDIARRDPALAIEILELQRLVKGYSDTHANAGTKFAKAMAMARRLDGRADAADWVRRVRDAALADADGVALEGAIRTIESFL